MKKFVIVIGQSASGKTTFVKEKFLKQGFTNKISPIKHCIAGKVLLAGNYGVHTCDGADTLGFVQLPIFIEFLKENINNFETFVLEGERITKKKLLEFLKSMQANIEVYLFNCSIETSIKRKLNRKEGSYWQNRKTFYTPYIKGTKTKARNFANECKELGFKVIEVDTEKSHAEKQLSFL